MADEQRRHRLERVWDINETTMNVAAATYSKHLDALTTVVLPKNWVVVHSGASCIYRPKGKLMPVVKVCLSINQIEVDQKVKNKVKSSITPFKGVATLAATVQAQLALLAPAG
jgi:hypothetical protein